MADNGSNYAELAAKIQNLKLENDILRQTIEYSRSIIHLNQIYAFVGEQNQASRQLFESMNFQQTTCLKQWLRTEEGYEDVVVYQLFL